MSPLSPPQDAEAKPWANGDHHLSQVRSRWPTAPRGSPSKPGGDGCHVAFIKRYRGGGVMWFGSKFGILIFGWKQKQKHKWNAPKVSFTILNWMAEVLIKKKKWFILILQDGHPHSNQNNLGNLATRLWRSPVSLWWDTIGRATSFRLVGLLATNLSRNHHDAGWSFKKPAPVNKVL